MRHMGTPGANVRWVRLWESARSGGGPSIALEYLPFPEGELQRGYNLPGLTAALNSDMCSMVRQGITTCMRVGRGVRLAAYNVPAGLPRLTCTSGLTSVN